MKRRYILLLGILFLAACISRQRIVSDPIPPYESFNIDSKQVREQRVINVWLPPGYAQSEMRFPVLYMPDGGVKEDFSHIANTLDQLIRAQKIPPYILVGIENTERGRDLTGASEVEEHRKHNIPMTDGAQHFRAFIAEELIPEIDRRYRSNATRGIIGESLAGLFVMETFFLTPATFDCYIAVDPSLWWNDNYLGRNAKTLLQNLPDRPTRLWFAGSSTVDIKQYTDQLAEFLAQEKLPQLIWKYAPDPKEKHHTIFRATKEKALIWSLNPDS